MKIKIQDSVIDLSDGRIPWMIAFQNNRERLRFIKNLQNMSGPDLAFRYAQVDSSWTPEQVQEFMRDL